MHTIKKNRIARFAVLLLVLTLMTSCFVGGTFAKYTSTVTASDTATVAKWDIKVNDTQIAVETPTITFNLFDTIKDTGNAVEEDVKSTLIAPGTEGSFALKIDNDSEVNAKWTIALAETNGSNIPLQYSVDGIAWVDSIADLSMTDLTEQPIAMETGTVTKTVYWRWMFNDTITAVADGNTSTTDAHAGQTNATDTALGILAQGVAPTVTIEATITVEQVD